MKELLSNKFALIQFDVDETVTVVETRFIIPPRGKLFNYDLKFTVGLKSAGTSKSRNLGCFVLVLSIKYNKDNLKDLLDDFESGKLSIKEIQRKRDDVEEIDNDDDANDSNASNSVPTTNQRVSQRNRKGKKDDQFEYAGTPTKKKQQQHLTSAQTKRNSNSSVLSATKKTNENLLELIKKDRAENLFAQNKKSSKTSKGIGDDDGNKNYFTSTQQSPSESSVPALDYDDDNLSLLLSSVGSVRIRNRSRSPPSISQ